MTATDPFTGLRLKGRSLANVPLKWERTTIEQILEVVGLDNSAPHDRWRNASPADLQRQVSTARAEVEGIMSGYARHEGEAVPAYVRRVFSENGSRQSEQHADALRQLRRFTAWCRIEEAKAEKAEQERQARELAEREAAIARRRRLATPDPASVERLLAVIEAGRQAEETLARLPELIAQHQLAARARAEIAKSWFDAKSVRRSMAGEEFADLPEMPVMRAPPADLANTLHAACRVVAQL